MAAAGVELETDVKEFVRNHWTHPRLGDALKEKILNALDADDIGVDSVEDLACCTLEHWDKMQERGDFFVPISVLNALKTALREVPGRARVPGLHPGQATHTGT